MKRSTFLKKIGISGLLIGAGQLPVKAFEKEDDFVKLTILHTNDVHSRIDPFPSDAGQYAGQGGAMKRARLVEKVRSEEKNVLLLDSGDIFQGTPYFNVFKGELEMKLMSYMDYDAATIGNHDFDLGMEDLKKQMKFANFPLLSANYDFSNTTLNGKLSPYKIFEKGGVKVGVFGICIELDGLVLPKLYGETQYQDPVIKANETALFLKEEAQCDFVICLSHLGYRYKSDKIDDLKVAAASKNIDLILGGHTHTFLDEPTQIPNLDNELVLISQVGWAGLILGRLDVFFDRTKKKHCVTCKNKLV